MSEIETGPEQGDLGGAEDATPYLTQAKILPVDGVVYCLEHTAVHAATEDPYGYGEPDCSAKEHRGVYYRGRKGDLDESAQEGRGERPVISASSGDGLTDEERELVLWLVGQARTKAHEVTVTLHEIFRNGDGEVAAVQERLALLDTVLGKLGHGAEEEA